MAEVAEKIREKLRNVPHKPGIYLMKDRLGTVIYVGKDRICESASAVLSVRRGGWGGI